MEILAAFRRRIEERFLRPVDVLLSLYGRSLTQTRPGFAILALDCLLIDAVQSFREGRVSTGEVSPALSFTTFLASPRFSAFSRRDRDEFFHYVRNGLLHNGETRGDWKVRIDKPSILFKDVKTGSRTINPRLFHAAVVEEFEDFCREVQNGPFEVRERFLRRMDAICGLRPLPLDHLYFAYGSNLLEEEIQRDASNAEPVGVAFLPLYRLVFNKHSTTRKCDTASIEKTPLGIVWGTYTASVERTGKDYGNGRRVIGRMRLWCGFFRRAVMVIPLLTPSRLWARSHVREAAVPVLHICP
jgi:hypothetical protein